MSDAPSNTNDLLLWNLDKPSKEDEQEVMAAVTRPPPSPPRRLPSRPAYAHAKLAPQCTHLTMTRSWNPALECGHCGLPGPFGWVYRCSQDREELIEDLYYKGAKITGDSLGNLLVKGIKMRKGSPLAREDHLSFLSEVTAEQLVTYQPQQILKIIKQREDLKRTIREENVRKNSRMIGDRLPMPPGLAPRPFVPFGANPQRPWTPRWEDECQYRVCPRCRPSCRDRSFQSLNAVADGEMLPSAAIGYGFFPPGHRPVVDAEVVKNIGLRTVSDILTGSSSDDDSLDRSDSEVSAVDIINGHVLDELRSELPDSAKDESSEEGHDPECDIAQEIKAALPYLVSLPAPTLEEDHFFGVDQDQLMDHEGDEGDNQFGSEPPNVGEIGIAVLEESVELGVADLIVQV